MKRRIFVVWVFVVALSALAVAGVQAAAGGKSSIRPASWWSPAPAVAASSDANGATSWEDCLAAGAPSGNAPSVGDCITFDFRTSYWDPTNGSGPWLQLKCFRAGDDFEFEGQVSGTLILADSRPGFPGGWGYGVPFVLSGTAWHLGPANCTVQLGNKTNAGKFRTLASTSFSVSG